MKKYLITYLTMRGKQTEKIVISANSKDEAKQKIGKTRQIRFILEVKEV